MIKSLKSIFKAWVDRVLPNIPSEHVADYCDDASNYLLPEFSDIPEFPVIREYLPMDGWKEVPLEPVEEPLVPLGAFAGDLNNKHNAYSALFTDSIYSAQNDTSPYDREQLEGSLLTCFVRKPVADALLKAQSLLPEGHAFVVWDTFRTLEVQQALFDDYRDKLIDQKGMTMEEATEAAQQFVSIPSTDPTRPSPHNTGASVDLGIVRFTPNAWARLQQLNMVINNTEDPNKRYESEMLRMQLYRQATVLDMGTKFDEMSDAVSTCYYEEKLAQEGLNGKETVYLKNRRMLHNVMAQAGFSNYSEEWFHHDLGNQFDAKRTGKKKAIFGAATLSEENLAHELMRVNHQRGSELYRTLSTGVNKLGQPVALTPLEKMVQETAKKTGDLSKTNHPPASKLEVY